MPIKPVKLSLNLFFALLTGLFILGPLNSLYAQNAEGKNAPAEIQEDHDTQNLDKLLKDYNQDSEKVIKDAQKLIPKDDLEGIPESAFGDGETLNPDDAANLNGKARAGKFDPKLLKKNKPQEKLQDIKYSEAIRTLLEPLQSLSEKQLYTLLAETAKEKGADVYLDQFPKLAVFFVAVIKDKEAIPSAVKIMDDKDKTIRFAGIMIFTILLSIMLRKFMKKEGRPVWKAVGLWFFRQAVISGLRIGIIFFFYSTELTPVFNLGTKTFFNELI